MKTLSNVIKEGLYSNLGIDKSIDTSLSSTWVDVYNNQRDVIVKLVLCNDGKIRSVPEQTPTGTLYINDDALLEEGHLPSYLSFDVNKEYFSVQVCTPKLKSFENLPIVDNMRLIVSASIDCFDTITNCKYLDLCIYTKYIPKITNVKPIIHALSLSFQPLNIHSNPSARDAAHVVNVLNNMKGCKFGMNGYNDGIFIGISFVSKFLKNTDSISNLFKNNSFNDHIGEFYANQLPDLNFLDDAPSINKLCFQVSNQNTWINDPGGVMVTNFLEPVGRNTKKLENVYLYLKTKKDNLNYIAGCINNDKTYTGVKFYAISY